MLTQGPININNLNQEDLQTFLDTIILFFDQYRENFVHLIENININGELNLQNFQPLTQESLTYLQEFEITLPNSLISDAASENHQSHSAYEPTQCWWSKTL